MAGLAALLLALALAVVAPLPERSRLLVALLGWIFAVGLGAWAYRGRSGRVVPVTRLALASGIVAVIGASAMVFISLQVREILAGTIVFGAAGSSCDVEGQTESFSLGDPVYAVAHMQRVIEAGEEITMQVTWEGEAETAHSERSPEAFDCLGTPLRPPEPGSYAVVVTAGDEVLSAGSFEVAPQG
jgi:hypothetical protein